MLKALRKLIDRWLGPAPAPAAGPPATAQLDVTTLPPQEAEGPLEPREARPDREGAQPTLVAYDEDLLERARTQWQFGDWNSLAQLDRDTLQHHPDRAKLALLAAAGRLQVGVTDEARHYLRLAQDWGISKKLMAQILAAGVHNSLGCAAAHAGRQALMLRHFESSIALGAPRNDQRLLLQARVNTQLKEISSTSSAIKH